MSEVKKPTIIIVEDDIEVSLVLQDICKELGCDVLGTAEIAEEAVILIRKHQPDVVLIDYGLQGDRNGSDVVWMACGPVSPRVIYITGFGTPIELTRMQITKPHCILHKPINLDQLRAAICD